VILLEVTALVIFSVVVKLGLLNDVNIYVYRALHIDSYVIHLFSETASIPAFIAIIGAIILMDLTKLRKVSIFSKGLIIAIAINVLFVHVLKICLQIYRPGALYVKQAVEILSAEVYGYPSGHAARAFALATYFFTRLKTRNVVTLVFLWALGISVSRLLLGVHWLSDVLGGILVGTLSAHIANLALMHHKDSAE
jgi:undecaprenyl-diphosphatase